MKQNQVEYLSELKIRSSRRSKKLKKKKKKKKKKKERKKEKVCKWMRSVEIHQSEPHQHRINHRLERLAEDGLEWKRISSTKFICPKVQTLTIKDGKMDGGRARGRQTEPNGAKRKLDGGSLMRIKRRSEFDLNSIGFL